MSTKDTTSPLAVQVGGSHYREMPIQPAQYIHANGMGYLAGNVVKYISRYKGKGGPEDIHKAIHYCQLLLELEYGEKKSAVPTPAEQNKSSPYLMGIAKAPFLHAEVLQINNYQNRSQQPMKCGKQDCDGVLRASTDWLKCELCDYVQLHAPIEAANYVAAPPEKS